MISQLSQVMWWPTHLQMNWQAPPRRASKRTLRSETISSPSIGRTTCRSVNAPDIWHAMSVIRAKRVQYGNRRIPNAIPKDSDTTTEFVPKHIEIDHRAYWIVYRMASSNDHRDLTATDITAKGLHMEFDSITRSLAVPSYCPRRLPNGLPNDQKLSPNGTPNWMPNHITRGLPNDYREANEYSTKAVYTDGHSGPPRPYWIPHEEMPKSAYTMYKAAFREQRRASIVVSMTTVKLTC